MIFVLVLTLLKQGKLNQLEILYDYSSDINANYCRNKR